MKIYYNYGTAIFQFFAAFPLNNKRLKSEISLLDSTSLVSYNSSSIKLISLVVEIKDVLLSVDIRGSYNFGIHCMTYNEL